MDKITYRAIIEHDTTSGDTKGRKIEEFTIDELINKIVKSGDGWYVNHAHRCYPPVKFNKRTEQWDYKKVESITDIVKSTVHIKRLNREEKQCL